MWCSSHLHMSFLYHFFHFYPHSRLESSRIRTKSFPCINIWYDELFLLSIYVCNLIYRLYKLRQSLIFASLLAQAERRKCHHIRIIYIHYFLYSNHENDEIHTWFVWCSLIKYKGRCFWSCYLNVTNDVWYSTAAAVINRTDGIPASTDFAQILYITIFNFDD